MLNLLGINATTFALQIKEFVGTIFFTEYPTTTVFADNDNNPIIKEWVDCSDDGMIDRHFYYKTSKVLLKQFIDGYISHQDLITNSFDGLLYFQDVASSGMLSNIIVSSNHLPGQYKPASNFFVTQNDGVDIDVIYNFFGLSKLALLVPASESIKEISYSKKSETLNLHLHQGLGVGFGTINTDILGNTLVSFDKLYKDVALDYYLGKNRGSLSRKSNENNELLASINTEIYGNLAASYSILIRPKVVQYNVYENTSDTEIIARKVFNLISNSILLEAFQTEYLLHSNFTFDSYEKFLKKILEMQLNVELYWFNPVTADEYKERLDYRRANSILENIKNLNVATEDDFTKKGKFRAVNCDTGHFVFISTMGEHLTGHFNKAIKDASVQITFVALYEVQISQKVIKQPGKEPVKTVNTISAFQEVQPHYQEKLM